MMAIGLLPDLLADVPPRRRLERETEDALYIRAQYGLVAIVESLMRDDLVICARVDLDHPIYFADNQFTDCADCGCRLQHRPDYPAAPHRVCVCCAARRLRARGKPDG